MSRERYGRQFGGFTFLGDNADREGFFELTPREQAERLGWSNGCPRTKELSDPNHPHFGPEWIRQRYAETNFWFGEVVSMAEELNPDVAAMLVKYRKRESGEPADYFEPESVPETHSEEKSPMGGLWGYAISRVMIEGFGRGDNRTQDRMLKTLNILEEILPKAETPAELLATLSERVTLKMEISPAIIFCHILPAGLLEEHNCHTDFEELTQQLQEKAPVLWHAYNALEPQTRVDFEIASISI